MRSSVRVEWTAGPNSRVGVGFAPPTLAPRPTQGGRVIARGLGPAVKAALPAMAAHNRRGAETTPGLAEAEDGSAPIDPRRARFSSDLPMQFRWFFGASALPRFRSFGVLCVSTLSALPILLRFRALCVSALSAFPLFLRFRALCVSARAAPVARPVGVRGQLQSVSGKKSHRPVARRRCWI